MHTFNMRITARLRHKWLLYTVGAVAVLLDSERLLNWLVKVEVVDG